jgi:hypothetical protein
VRSLRLGHFNKASDDRRAQVRLTKVLFVGHPEAILQLTTRRLPKDHGDKRQRTVIGGDFGGDFGGGLAQSP